MDNHVMALLAATNLAESLDLLATIIKVAFGIGFVIFVHELGHFLAAKACGVKCEKFYVGFDVPKWSLFGIAMPSRFASVKWGETEYGVGLIPLGGYVKMLGQDDNPANAAKEAERIRVATEEPGADRAVAGTAVEPGTYALDPRSYPAKSVPQRMLIISAGIIMNLVFAVIMAAVAYKSGVRYVTCEIAGTSPGDPAWVAGLRVGDKILQIGKVGEPNEFLRFDKDLRFKVAAAGLGKEVPEPLDLLVRPAGREPAWVQITPRNRFKEKEAPVTLGVRSPTSTTLSRKQPVIEYMAAGRAEPPLAANDRIVGANGRVFDRAGVNEAGDLPSFALDAELVSHVHEPVRLTVERTQADDAVTTLEVLVPPSPAKWLGFSPAMGPVVAIQRGSPAEKAGVRMGDRLRTIDGEPIRDPIALSLAHTDWGSRDVVIEVERKAGKETETVSLTLTPAASESSPASYGPGAYLALDRLGIAYSIENRIGAVAANSAAASQGLVTGSQLVAVQFLPRDEKAHEYALKWLNKSYNDLIELDEVNNWVAIHGMLQQLPPNLEARVAVRHEGREKTVTLTPVELPGVYDVERGLNLTRFERIHTAAGWGDAFQLGYRETKERLQEVAAVLGLLIQGKLSVNNLGGPIRIAAFAGYEAAQGLPRLLMFLTFLSANLALLNALPIPVLDGGHFLFLLVEGVIRRPVPEKWQTGLTFVGFACLLLLMLFVFANDIKWLFL